MQSGVILTISILLLHGGFIYIYGSPLRDGCTPKRLPVWVDGIAGHVVGKSGDQPSAKEASDAAQKDAYSQLFNIVGVSGQSSLNDNSTILFHDSLDSDILRNINIFITKIPPIKIFDQECKRKGDTYYRSFVILKYESRRDQFRNRVISHIYTLIDEKYQKAQEYLKSSDFLEYLHVLLKVEELAIEATSLMGTIDSSLRRIDEFELRARGEIRAVISNFVFEIYNDKQDARTGQPLGEPFEVRVKYSSIDEIYPVAGFPLRFHFTRGSGRIKDSLTVSNSKGLASVEVELVDDALISNEVTFVPDIPQLKQDYSSIFETGYFTFTDHTAGVGPWPELDSVEMIYIMPSTFMMGASKEDEYASNDEKMHKVVVDRGFYLDEHEVTNRQYRNFVDSTNRARLPAYWDDPEYNGDNQPVVGVTWGDATDYARWTGKRLPTEAEWELAARGSGGRVYPWGNQFIASIANCFEYDPGDPKVRDVKSFPTGKTPEGVYDLSGNVWEWVSDGYSEDYSPNPSIDYKVRKGGSWRATRIELRASNRDGKSSTGRYPDTGFRCAKDSRKEGDNELMNIP